MATRQATNKPRPMPEFTSEALARFLTRYEKLPNGCWQWSGRLRDYGSFWYSGANWPAHRVAHAIFLGDPGNQLVCHSCDNTSCVNPAHLWLGDDAENALDKKAKGRCRNGSRRSVQEYCRICGHHRTDDLVVKKEGRRTSLRCRACARAHNARNYRRRADLARSTGAV